MENYQQDTSREWKDREFSRGESRIRPMRKSYRDSSPEEVKQAVKEQVSKGVAAAAGAIEGFAEEVENDHLPETAEKAIELAGETTRRIAKTSVEQARRTKDAIDESLHEESSQGDSSGTDAWGEQGRTL